jgi:hypothetical protein
MPGSLSSTLQRGGISWRRRVRRLAYLINAPKVCSTSSSQRRAVSRAFETTRCASTGLGSEPSTRCEPPSTLPGAYEQLRADALARLEVTRDDLRRKVEERVKPFIAATEQAQEPVRRGAAQGRHLSRPGDVEQ